MIYLVKSNRFLTYINIIIFQFWLYLSAEGKSILPHFLMLSIEVVFILNTLLTLYIKKNRKFNKLTIYLLVLTFFAYVLGLQYFSRQIVDVDRNTDLLICFMLINGPLLVSEKEENIIKFLNILLISSCVISLYELMHFDISSLRTIVIDRSALWELKVFYCTPLFWFIPFYIIYAFVYKKSYLLAILAWTIALLLNAIATKREFLVESAWLIVVLFFFFYRTKQLSNIKSILIIIIIAFAGLYSIQSFTHFNISALFQLQIDRLSSDEVESNGFIRFQEFINYFGSSNFINWIFGKGLGIPHNGLGFLPNTALHIGFFNYIFKFGIFLSLPYLYYLFKSLHNIKHLESIYLTDKWRVVCVLSVLWSAPSFFLVSNFWALIPSVCFFWYFLLRSTTAKCTSNNRPGQAVAACK